MVSIWGLGALKKHCYLTLHGQDDMDLMFSPHAVITLALSFC